MANVEVRGMDTLRRVLDNAGNLPPTRCGTSSSS